MQLDEAVVEIDVHLHLARVLVGQAADLQIDEHEAAQQSLVEHQVDLEVLILEGEPSLASLE